MLKVAAGKVVPIYADFWYAYSIQIALVAYLLEAISLLSQQAFVKCAAHTFGSDPVIYGNMWAHTATREAAISSSHPW